MFTLPPAAWQPPIRLIKPWYWLSPLSCIFSLDIQLHDLTEGRNGNFMLRYGDYLRAARPRVQQAGTNEGGWAGKQHGPPISVLPLELLLEPC